MRKFFCISLSVGVLLIFMLNIVSANTAREENNNVGVFLTETDINKLVDYSRTTDISAVKESQQKVGEGYYLYSLLLPDIVMSFEKGTCIRDIISDSYYIIVPRENGYVKYLKDDNGKVSYVGDVLFNGSSRNTNVVNISVVKSILENKKYSKATDVKAIDAPMYQTSFVYFRSNGEEYLIPFGSRPDLTGLENGKVYNVVDCLSVLSTTYGCVSVDGDGSSNENGGYVDSFWGSFNKITNFIMWGIMICSGMFLGAIILNDIRKSKKKRL